MLSEYQFRDVSDVLVNQQKTIDVKQEVIKSSDHFFNNNEHKVIEKVKKYCDSQKNQGKQIFPHIFFFIHPVVLGKAEGSFFRVLIEIYAKAADSTKEES